MKAIFAALVLLVSVHVIPAFAQKVAQRPNILLIITDDQGYGDFGFTGNPYVKTPNIDKLAAISTRLTNFHSSPVCAPTRASLLTGRYHQRTGVHDTYNNGAIMAAEETTLAELLGANGYRTGIVGKWHLGDNYPFRPSDQGFQYSLVHGGGGIGQPGDDIENFIRKDSSYFNSTLIENDGKVRSKGYCSDVFTDHAISFIKDRNASPFFLYVSYNAPHDPLQLPKKYEEMYQNLKFDSESDKQNGLGMTEKEKESARKVYGMVTNIDDNVGRILNALKTEKLEENTIVIFMTDNGNQQFRFNTGLRGLKGSVYEGGTLVPFLISGAGVFSENKEVKALLAHIDVLPTLLEAVKIPVPAKIRFDGHSGLKIILGKATQKERIFYNSWNRGWPEPYRNAALYKGKYKLVADNIDGNDISSFGLFDLETDPFEKNSLSAKQPEMAGSMRKSLDSVFKEISASPHLVQQRIIVGSKHENPSTLTRQDLGGTAVVNWNADQATGYWTISVSESGFYNFKSINIKPIQKGTRTVVRLGQIQRSVVSAGAISSASIDHIYVKKGNYNLESWYETGNGIAGPYYMEVSRGK
jgi:arylsulfatase